MENVTPNLVEEHLAQHRVPHVRRNRIRHDDDTERTVFSEYHAVGARSAAFMIRRGEWKYIHYAGDAPELFNLADDPEEETDLAGVVAHAAMMGSLKAELMAVLSPESPEDVDARAKQDQTALVERHGGREAVLKKGGFQGTPAPGDEVKYVE